MPRSPCSKPLQEDQVALPQRQVEAPFGAPLGDELLVRGREIAELRQHRIARHRIGEQEDDQRREQRHHDRKREPGQDVARHVSITPPAQARAPGAPRMCDVFAESPPGIHRCPPAGVTPCRSSIQPAAVSGNSLIVLRTAIW